MRTGGPPGAPKPDAFRVLPCGRGAWCAGDPVTGRPAAHVCGLASDRVRRTWQRRRQLPGTAVASYSADEAPLPSGVPRADGVWRAGVAGTVEAPVGRTQARKWAANSRRVKGPRVGEPIGCPGPVRGVLGRPLSGKGMCAVVFQGDGYGDGYDR